jgi:hypothetical protein
LEQARQAWHPCIRRSFSQTFSTSAPFDFAPAKKASTSKSVLPRFRGLPISATIFISRSSQTRELGFDHPYDTHFPQNLILITGWRPYFRLKREGKIREHKKDGKMI